MEPQMRKQGAYTKDKNDQSILRKKKDFSKLMEKANSEQFVDFKRLLSPYKTLVSMIKRSNFYECKSLL